MDFLGPAVSSVIEAITGFRTRRRVRVRVHRGVFLGGFGATPLTTEPELLSSPPVTGSPGPNPAHYYFVKVVNVSDSRKIEVTHVWFKTEPEVVVTNGTEPLPVRLRPDEGWEGWVPAAAVDHQPDAAWRCRVRLSNGKVVRSRPNYDLPSTGTVGGRRRP
jgi:hypothetical protein